MSIHKIAAKLTVMCAILDKRETADADLPKGRIATALKLAREASALASAEQTRLEKASAAWALALTRTAMLTEAMPPADPHWVELCVTLDLTPAQWETYRPLLHVEDGVRVTVEPVAHVERTGAEVSAQPAAPLRPAEGAAAERERRAEQSSGVEWMPLSKASVLWSQCTGKPEPSQPRWCSCGKPRPYVGGTLCKCMDCGGFCDIAEPEPVAQPHGLAGRIRALLAEIMPEPHATGPVDGRRYWTSVVPRGDGKGLRMGLDWEREASAARREEAIEYLVDRIEAVVRGAEVKP